MSSQRIHHVLTLHLYQPPGALNQLLRESEAELQRILKCYERIARYTRKYADVARLHVVFSASLLRQLKDPGFIEETRHLEDVPGILESFRSAPNIEFIASGLYHAPLPLIPRQDWDAQLRSERSLIEESFGHQPRGYFPPGGLFDETMIPHLIASGYRFVLLPKTALTDGEGNPVDPYRSYRLSDNFFAIPIDDGFSHAQEHFIEAPWFADEVVNGVHIAPESASPYLVTTCSDGENGDWFRRSDEENGFFGHFFAPYMEFCETGEYPIRPVNVIDYLKQAKPEPARLARQEMPASDHPALKRLQAVSRQYWEQTGSGGAVDPGIHDRILQAEESCFVFDPDPGFHSLTALLDSLSGELGTPKTGKPASANAEVGTPAPPPGVRASSSTPPSAEPAPRETTTSQAKGSSRNKGKKGMRPKSKATAPRKKKSGARKKAAARKKKVHTAERPPSTGHKRRPR